MRWRTRSGRSPDLPPLPEAPKVSDLPEARMQSTAKYLGTAADGEKVTSHGLGGRGSARVLLSDDALDVVRLGAPFRIPLAALRGASHQGDAIVVLWEHGGRVLETTLQLTAPRGSAPDAVVEKQRSWVRRIGKLARKHGAP